MKKDALLPKGKTCEQRKQKNDRVFGLFLLHPSQIAAPQVVCFPEAKLLHLLCGARATATGTAVDIHRFGFIQLLNFSSKIVIHYINIHCLTDVSLCIFSRRAHVNQLDVASGDFRLKIRNAQYFAFGSRQYCRFGFILRLTSHRRQGDDEGKEKPFFHLLFYLQRYKVLHTENRNIHRRMKEAVLQILAREAQTEKASAATATKAFSVVFHAITLPTRQEV